MPRAANPCLLGSPSIPVATFNCAASQQPSLTDQNQISRSNTLSTPSYLNIQRQTVEWGQLQARTKEHRTCDYNPAKHACCKDAARRYDERGPAPGPFFFRQEERGRDGVANVCER